MADLFNEEQQRVFNEKLAEKQEQWKRKYEGYLSPDDVKARDAEKEKQIAELTKALEDSSKKIESFNKDIADRDSRIKAYESHSVKTRIAHEVGLGFDAIDFLKGDDEDSIRTSAESLKALMGTHRTAPTPSAEPKVETDGSKEAIKSLAKSLTSK